MSTDLYIPPTYWLTPAEADKEIKAWLRRKDVRSALDWNTFSTSSSVIQDSAKRHPGTIRTCIWAYPVTTPEVSEYDPPTLRDALVDLPGVVEIEMVGFHYTPNNESLRKSYRPGVHVRRERTLPFRPYSDRMSGAA